MFAAAGQALAIIIVPNTIGDMLKGKNASTVKEGNTIRDIADTKYTLFIFMVALRSILARDTPAISIAKGAFIPLKKLMGAYTMLGKDILNINITKPT